MLENTISLIPYAVLLSHAFFIFLFLALVFRKSWGRKIVLWVGDKGLILSFLVALGALFGSLFYSEIVGFEACSLCWWQRVFLYPLVVIFGVAIWKKNDFAFLYAVPLALLAGIVAIYHWYTNLGGVSLLPCTSLEGACSKIYVLAFGYITIPLMSLTIVAFILIFAWTHKIYKNENSNS